MDAKTLSEVMGASLPLSRYEELLPAFNEAMRLSDVTTVNRAAMWCAQLGHESTGLRDMEEWHDGSNYEFQANIGNTQPGDGVRFKGRGPIQITGRFNYSALSKWAFERGLVSSPTYFLDKPADLSIGQYAFLGPVWYWTTTRRNYRGKVESINDFADDKDIVSATKAINGGTNNLADRQKRYTKALRMGDRLLPGKKVDVVLKPQPGRQGDPVWLPQVLKAFGVAVKEDPGWLKWGMGDFTDIWGVIAHHTAGANTSAAYIKNNPGIGNSLSSQIHLGRDGVCTLVGVGIAYHAGEDNSGKYLPGYVNRPSASGMKQYTAANARTIGVEAVNTGNGTQVWPQVQMDAYYRICAAICWYLGLPVSRVLGHKEIAPGRKVDPNFDMGQFRTKVQYYIDNPPHLVAAQKPVTTKTSKEDDDMLKRIHFELTNRFPSRYPGSKFEETLVGYALEADRKIEDVHKNMLPHMNGEIKEIKTDIAAIKAALNIKEINNG